MLKKITLLVIAVFTTTISFGQFYASGSAGYAFASANMRMGLEQDNTSEKAVFGTYGRGLNGQVRLGYHFNETFGFSLGVGYLHGDDITIRDVNVTGRKIDIIGHGRAFGLMPALTYNFNKNLYGRIGAVLKVGGKTEVVGNIETLIPAQALNPALPAEAFASLDVDFTRDFKGTLPLGFTAAFGYKLDLNDNLSVFAEAEYLGISVKRDEATLADFNSTLAIPGVGTSNPTNKELLQTIAGSPALAGDPTIQTLAALISDETNFVDERDFGDDSVLAETAPYSSFGINIGITYTFGAK